MEQLLSTKFYIPPTRRKLISRPRLVEKINQGLHRNLTLISAPAGFGKTTLVSEWVEQSRVDGKNKFSIAWLSLDESDNDLIHFLSYFVAAFRRVEEIDNRLGEGALSMLQTPQPPPTETILTALINDISTVSNKVILVLDDYHLISQPTIDDALSFLLENLPPQVHLIIVTRVDPQLPLARLRAGDQLNELRATDLRFTSSEAAEFLNETMGLTLSEEDITSLESRTEGWIAGLQLAAISMQGREDSSNYIKSFTGSHRLVLDYLIEEVLEQQSENNQDFLLKTAILDRMTGGLCDAVVGREDSQETLEYLEQTNLFIVPLDNERRWYRYHHLFADFLRQRLELNYPNQMTLLHRLATSWYEQNGFIDETIKHALLGEDYEHAICLIEQIAETYWETANISNLRNWLEILPNELVDSSLKLSIFHAWFLRGKGKLDEAEQTLAAAEQALEINLDQSTSSSKKKQKDLKSSEIKKFNGRAAAIRAFISSYQGDVPGIIQFGQKARELLPNEDLNWRSMTAIALGDAHGYLGDMKSAYEARSEALQACKAVGDMHFIIVANLKVAITLREQGLLQSTLEICQQQMKLADKIGLQRTRLVGFLLSIWGETLTELGDPFQGIDLAKKGFKLLERKGNMEMLGWSYLSLMRVLFSLQDWTGAELFTNKIKHISFGTITPPWIPNHIKGWDARLSLVQGRHEVTYQWLEEHESFTKGKPKPIKDIDYFCLFDYLVYIRILIAQGQIDKTIKLLPHLLKAAEAGGRTTKVIEILILQAISAQSMHEIDQAILILERALILAEQTGFFQIFIDERAPMGQLLYEALGRGISPDYVSRLLNAFPVIEQEHTALEKTQDPNGNLIEPLTDRECEVLRLIANGLTNQEIAKRLVLSRNTVKVHTRNIFGKLNVGNRMQAAAKAKALGILPPD